MSATKRVELNLRGFPVAAMVIAVVLAASPANAAQIFWQKNSYSCYVEKADIGNILTDFFAAQGIGVVCSENVKGVISGNFENKDCMAFLEHIADAYNLIWYYDGAAVFVYSAQEIASRIIDLGYLDVDRFKRSMIELDALDPRFPLRTIESERIVYVVGPRRYVELVSQMAEQLDAKAMAQRGRDDIVKVFPLKYAWAEDKTIVFRDKQITVPGVATLLSNLITGRTTPGQAGGKDGLTLPLNKLKGKGLAQYRHKRDEQSVHDDDEPVTATQQDPADEPSQNPPYKETDTAFVQADIRQNAVVVRDRDEKMLYYKEIIELLDKPVGLVEIRATIMDIDRGDLLELGVNWEFAGTSDDGERVTKGGSNTTELFSAENGLQLPVGEGLNLATLIGDAGNYFLAKVHALEKKGRARILSRPMVLTINNVEAQLEHSKTFFVRVAGDREVDLFDVNAGVVLRVTPHVIEEQGQTLIKLAIQIEDGEITDERVDNIPAVKKSIVNTQAVVGQKESLLIGGYIKESNITKDYKVPCLGDVPLLGWLFRKSSTAGDESERLFLITPAIVPYRPTGTQFDYNGEKPPNESEKNQIEQFKKSLDFPGRPVP